jgi:hypothetical protein
MEGYANFEKERSERRVGASLSVNSSDLKAKLLQPLRAAYVDVSRRARMVFT